MDIIHKAISTSFEVDIIQYLPRSDDVTLVFAYKRELK